MKGLDTNILLRFLLKDEPRQAKAARAVIAKAIADNDPSCICLLTVLEMEWVLRSRGGFDKAEIISTFKQLLEAKDLRFEDEAVLEHGIYLYENSNAEFADCLQVARYRALGCSSMLTFDIKAGKLPGAEMLGA